MQEVTGYKYLQFSSFKNLSFWDYYTLTNQAAFDSSFPIVKLGEVLTHRKQFITIDDKQEYKRCRVQLYGNGIVLRDIVKGAEIKTKKQQVCKTDDFLVAEIDAKFGGYGVVPDNLEEAIVSGHYFLFEINKDKLLPEFLAIVVKCNGFAKQVKATGSTNYAAIRPYHVLRYKIPLPSLETQKDLVTQYKSELQQTQNLKDSIRFLKDDINTLLASKLGLVVNAPRKVQKQFLLIRYRDLKIWGVDGILYNTVSNTTAFPTKTLRSLHHIVRLATRGKSPVYSENGNQKILNQKCNRWNNIQPQFAKTVDDNWYATIDPNLFTKEGDIIINSTGEGTIGRASLITKEHEGYLYDSHMILLRLDSEQINPLYFVYIINSMYGQDQINNLKSAKSTKQTELGVQNLLKINFPLPERAVQDEMAAKIKLKEKEIVDLEAHIEQSSSTAIADFERIIFS